MGLIVRLIFVEKANGMSSLTNYSEPSYTAIFSAHQDRLLTRLSIYSRGRPDLRSTDRELFLLDDTNYNTHLARDSSLTQTILDPKWHLRERKNLKVKLTHPRLYSDERLGVSGM